MPAAHFQQNRPITDGIANKPISPFSIKLRANRFMLTQRFVANLERGEKNLLDNKASLSVALGIQFLYFW